MPTHTEEYPVPDPVAVGTTQVPPTALTALEAGLVKLVSTA
jgi:hypothetical protein